MNNALPATIAIEIENAEEAIIAYTREHYGPMWSHVDQAEAERLTGRLMALYEKHGVAEIDRIAA